MITNIRLHDTELHAPHTLLAPSSLQGRAKGLRLKF